MTESETLNAVNRWYALAGTGQWQRIPEAAGPTYTRHEPAGTRVVTADDYAREIGEQVAQRGVLKWEYSAFADNDIAVVVLRALGTPRGDISTVQAFRVADDKLVETWVGPFAPVAWPLPGDVGEGDGDANGRLLRRWYEEMYEQRRFAELAPELCGPVFTRHEAAGTSDVTAEEYGARLASSVGQRDEVEGRTPLIENYRVFTSGDRVGVIGTSGRRGSYVQVWRVKDNKLVESWWSGFAGVNWET
ncbi:MAG: hypothetical protein KC470_06635 [Dehalococcoidia bacterium]|nr:hypothetical protein [Dehalococcoidia bacterium]